MASRDPLGPLGRAGPGAAGGVLAVAAWLVLERVMTLATPGGSVAHLFPASEFGLIALRRLVEIGLFLLYWLLRGWTLEDLGLAGSRAARGLSLGCVWAAASAAAALAIELAFRFGVGVSFLHLVAGRPLRGDDLAVLLLAGGLVGPVFEEILFRGYLYGGLRKQLDAPWAVALTALLFASAHTSFQGVHAVQAAGGVLFALAYEFSGSLWAPLVLHVTGNLAIFLMPLVL